MDSKGIGERHWVHKPKHLYLQAHPSILHKSSSLALGILGWVVSPAKSPETVEATFPLFENSTLPFSRQYVRWGSLGAQ